MGAKFMPSKTSSPVTWLFVFAGMAMVSCLGCGGGNDGRYHVAGQARFNGQPIPVGRIVFEPDLKRGNSGPQGFASIEAGKYDTRLQGRPSVAGPVLIKIEGFAQLSTSEEDGSAGALFKPPYTQAGEIPQHDSALDFNIESPAR